MPAEFIVAQNPDAESTLPFLLHLPLEDGLWLKSREAWPRGSRVYCHPAEPRDVETLQVIERVPIVACERRGPAIDLVLARGSNKRSQFIFTTYKGRRMIFWQTPKAAAASRPGLRIPYARAGTHATFYIDTRERYGYSFKAHGAAAIRRALGCGDYAVECDGRIVAVVERKTADDVVRSLVDGTLNFAMAELASFPAAAVVVEATYSSLLRHEFTRAGFIPDLLARLQVRYPGVAIVFVETRKIGEEWTFRFLRAAHADAGAAALPVAPPSPPTSPEKKAKRGRSRPNS